MKKTSADNRKYYPLTHAQKRIYYDDKIYPGTSAGTQAFIVKYRQIVDKKLLERAINKVILKNEGFRLRVVEFDFEPEPSQYVSEFDEISLDEFDFSGPDGEARLRSWLDRTTKKSIPLIDGPLFYFAYIKFNETESGYYMKFHHATSDGWSYPLIFSEINRIYKDLQAGKRSDESPNPSYIPYISEELEYLKSEQLYKDKEFWHNYLLPLPEPAALSTKTGTPESIRGNVLVVAIPEHLHCKIDEYCKSTRTSLFKLFFSALAAYVSRVTGLEDVVIAGVNHNRAVESRQGVIGMFVSTIPFRVTVEGDMAFNRFVEKAGKETINYILKNHQRYPFDRLATELRERSGTDIGYLADIIISAHGDVERGNYVFEHIYQGYQANALTIHLNYNNKYQEGILEIEYEYQVGRFSQPDMRRIHQGIVNVLNDVVENPGNRISEIVLLSEDEKKQIIYEFNNTEVQYPQDKTIHELFEYHAAQTPGNIALKFGDEELTYRQLNEKANQLARLLKEKGVKPDHIVGILVERSIEMIIGIFAILKSGGAYLPLDPNYPEGRVRYLLKDSSSRLLLTMNMYGQYVEKIDFDHDVMELDDESLYQGDCGNLDIVNSPRDLAYIIYTSGSTGLPKGVMIDHVSAINTIMTLYDKYPLNQADTYLLKTAFLFDVSVSELFGWFWGGGKLAILKPGEEKDPHHILDAIEEEKITHINFVPSLFNLFVNILDERNIAKLSGLKYIFLAGEAIWPDSIIKFRYLDKNVVNENLYGPTEATIYASMYPVAKWDGTGSVPIGVPIDNTKLFILGRNESGAVMQPVGIPGELVITGIGLARGYLNRPMLTSEKFIDNPFAGEEGLQGPSFGKIYLTGDLCRWFPDGNVEYMGRIDQQVKIRGFRIETGEIEVQLSTLAEIKEAVVMAREDHAGEKYLCAYIVSGREVDAAKISDTLAGSLPEYMIPSYFVPVESIPLTPTGKVNRRALPAPQIKEKAKDYAAPRNHVEEKLAEIWAELLHMKTDIISIDDNFFKVGGHSLKAAMMITMIHKELNVKILMHEIFDMPTIRKLSEYILGAVEEKFTAIQLSESKEYYPQTSAQKRMFFMDQLGENSILYNIQIMDVYCKGIEKRDLEEAFKKLIKRHESLRTSFHTIEGEAVQVIHESEEVAADFEVEYYETTEEGLIYAAEPEKQGVWEESQMRAIPFMEVVENFVRPFDLCKPPLCRVGLIKIWGNTKILMLDIHHTISDGISLVILLNDLWALYEEEELPGLRVQYKDFAQWSRSAPQQQEIKKQEPFWLEAFSGELSPLNLPGDYPRPAAMTFDGDTIHFELSNEKSRKLNMMAKEQGYTLYMVLLAVYNVLLGKLSGQEDIVVGTFTAGRSHADIQPLIGMFVDTLALRNYPQGETTFKAFLGEVKKRTLAAFENQGYPFDQLVNKVAPNYEKNRNPLFDVAFALENEAERSEEYLIEALMLDKTNPYKPKRSKFDLMLWGAETEERLQFSFEYNTKLFKEQTIERFISYFNKIIASVSGNIWQKIADIEMISLEEKLEMLYIFNDTETAYPQDKTINEIFEAQVEKTPGNIAIIYQDKQLTYREFNNKANQLARVLRQKGVTPDHFVGLMVERSLEMMIGMVAVLKAGGAYLPMDPDYPLDRIIYILRDSDSRLLLTQQKFAGEIDFGGEVMDLADESLFRGSGESRNLPLVNSPGDLAYAIFTSGSTGKPKGVMIEHWSVINLAFTQRKSFKIAPRERILQFSSISFDASVEQIYITIFSGAALVLIDKMALLDMKNFERFICTRSLTHIHAVPLFVSNIPIKKYPGLKRVIAGGDVCPLNLVNSWTKYCDFCNEYGPTETTVTSIQLLVEKLVVEKNGKALVQMSIGKPLGNTIIYILDQRLRPAPIGVAGDLYIGGDGVSRGYMNRPELILERFLPNSNFEWGSIFKTGNVYKTGDLARWLADGNIEFLGRSDFQVKIRGFRIELGEIENQLLQQGDINEVVVVAREDPAGQKYLCAYIRVDKPVDVESVKQSLTRDLPDYMLPSYLVQMENFPLTPSGKIDRKALPVPEIKGAGEYTAPTNETEKILAKTWSEVLGIEKVGIDDNFFEIGGDSIKTILISGRLQKLGISIPVNELFLNPTIRKLAKFIQKEKIVPAEKEEIITRDQKLIDADIKKDYEAYLEKIRQEEWPDLRVENDYKHILLTGATGYLGSYLAHELLEKTGAALYLTVRGDEAGEPERRLKKGLSFYFGENFYDKYKDRIRVLWVDLRKDRMGLDKAQYEKLAETVDAVVHSAANVKHYGDYEELYKDNVGGTERVLDFAVTGKYKDFHFISTIDTGRGDIEGKDYLVFTEYCLDEGQKSDHIYIKSKFAAEKRVLEYREKGLNASIYRAGNVTFQSGTGQFQVNYQNNVFYAIVRSIINVGFLSESMKKLEFDMSFADYTARAIVLLLTRAQLENEIYHIGNPNKLPVKELTGFLKEMGVEVPVVEEGEIETHLAQYEGNSEYEKIIERVKIDSWAWEKKPTTVTVPKLDRTVMLLKKLDFEWPKVTRRHIEKMINHPLTKDWLIVKKK